MKPRDPKWLAEWRRKKRAGEIGKVTGHVRYGRLDRAIERSLEIERPALSELSGAELERLETRFEIEGAA